MCFVNISKIIPVIYILQNFINLGLPSPLPKILQLFPIVAIVQVEWKN